MIAGRSGFGLIFRAHLALMLISLSVLGTARGQSSAGLAEVRIRGDVRKIQPMPDGSFVLGGFTAYFNGVRDTQLIRVAPNGTRVAFPVTVGGSVQAMALSDGWLYIGGDFQVVNNTSCPFVARVDTVTGDVDPFWRPAPNGDLLDIVPVSGGVVLSGSFSQVGGLPRNRLALVSTAGSGLPDETWQCDADDQVDRLLAHQGWLYAAGRFQNIGGRHVPALARLNPGTGVVDSSWAPTPNGNVYDIAADAANIYCGGNFTRIGNALVPYLARLPLNSGNADIGWAPLPSDLVARLCVSGDSVYAVGSFEVISGFPQKFIARIPKTGGTADGSWRPAIDGALLALVPDGADGLWGGGRFDSDATGGSGFAHFTKTQGSSAPQYPAKIENLGGIKVIKPDPTTGGWLVGGDFDTVNGIKRHALFRLQSNRALDPQWSANLSGFYTEVNALDIIPDANDGGDVLIGGQFEVDGIGEDVLYNCLLLKLSNGTVVPGFKPQPSSTVYTIVHEAGTWLIGGSFTSLGVQQANYIARIRTDGHADPIFAPNPNGPVHAILEVNGETYIGGEFTAFQGAVNAIPLPYLARVYATVPDIGWQPRPNQAVFALAADGNFLYAGGRFSRMSRTRRRNLAQLPMGGAGTATAWSPNPDNEVNSIVVANGHLYVGGSFFSLANYQWPKLARFQLGALSLDTTFRTTGEDGAVLTIEPQTTGELFVGGSFSGWDDDFSKRSLVAIRPGANSAPSDLLHSLATTSTGPADEQADLRADYFAPSSDGTGTVRARFSGSAPGLEWEENSGLPHGMVGRVQWSTDLRSWHESGERVAGGRTWFISIAAEGTRRSASLKSDGLAKIPANAFMRVIVTPSQNPPAKLLP